MRRCVPGRVGPGVLALLLGLIVFIAMTGTGATVAMFNDVEATPTQSVAAGSWIPDPPAECVEVLGHELNPVWGTPGDDVLYGTVHRDVIYGGSGDDVIHGDNQGDCLIGGPGDDVLHGGNSTDVLIGGAGRDTLYGNNGGDFLYGDADDDWLYGGNAPDGLNGGEGYDQCFGGLGVDTKISCEAGSG